MVNRRSDTDLGNTQSAPRGTHLFDLMRFFEIATTDLDLLLFHKKATTRCDYKLLLFLQ